MDAKKKAEEIVREYVWEVGQENIKLKELVEESKELCELALEKSDLVRQLSNGWLKKYNEVMGE